MADCMTFPKTANEFIEQYSFKDKKQEYTNGAELIPVIRVEQMLEHYFATDNNVGHKWIPVTERLPEKEGLYIVHGKLGGVFVLFYDDTLSDSFKQMCTHWMPLPQPPKGERL